MRLDEVNVVKKYDTPDMFDVHTWDEPVPFADNPPPAFPTDALTYWIKDFVEGEALATQTPADLSSVLALVVIGASIAKKYRIEVRAGWTEQPNLFGVVALPPGSRKTAVFRDVCAPMSAYEKIATEQMKSVILRQKIKKGLATKLVEEAEKICMVKGGSEDSVRTHMQLAEAAEGIVVPASPRFVIDDATPEKLVNILFRQGGKIALLSPEGGVFERIAGKASSGTDAIEVYLKAHAGDDIRLDRISRGEEFIEAPAMSIGLAVQPDIIRALGTKTGFRGRGLIARFLFSMPFSNIGNRNTNTEPIGERVAALYTECLLDLLACEVKDGPITLKLTAEASARFQKFESWVEPRLGPGGELTDLADWGSKLPGTAARLAAIIHAAEMVGTSKRVEAEPVSVDTIRRALKIAAYFVGHAKIAFNEIVFGKVHDDAKCILKWLGSVRKTRVTKRDTFRAMSDILAKAEMLDEPIRELKERGYLRELAFKVGKKTEVAFDVNPKIWENTNGAKSVVDVQTTEIGTGEQGVAGAGEAF